MGVYNALRSLVTYFAWLRSVFVSVGNAISDVWLIGDTLAGWFYEIATYIGMVEGGVSTLATEWYFFNQYITTHLTVSSALTTLLTYADDVIAFIRDLDYNIASAVRRQFPALGAFLANPPGYLVGVLTATTGLSLAFIKDPIGTINALVLGALGELQVLKNNPYSWLVGKLSQFNPTIAVLFQSPLAWLRDRLGELSPDLLALSRDPQGYIVAKFLVEVEMFVDRYKAQIARVAEKILQAIF